MQKTLTTIQTLAAIALSLGLLGAPGLACADGDHDKDANGHSGRDEDNFDQIRNSVRDGRLLPLATIKAEVEDRWPGEIVDISVGREHGRISYAFRVLNAKGRLVEIEINAADGTLLEVENE
jgi:uncharacterized membrane protein YkoI